jgi:uncharacterized RDD family membrane protein YckC
VAECESCGYRNEASAERCAGCGRPLGAGEIPLQPGETFRDPDDLSPVGAPPGAEPPAADDSGAAQPAREPDVKPGEGSGRPTRHRLARVEPRYAGFLVRLVAFAIDGAVLSLFAVPLAVAGIAGIKTAMLVLGLPTPIETQEALASLLSSGWAAMATVYFTALHRGAGQTIGKALLGIRVRSTELVAIGVIRSLVRTLGYALSSSFLGLGFLTVALTPRKRGWHDFLAGTCVVRLAADEA